MLERDNGVAGSGQGGHDDEAGLMKSHGRDRHERHAARRRALSPLLRVGVRR